MGMVIAAICPLHGSFESRGFDIQNSTDMHMIGNQESCPVRGCNRMAPVMDGTFSFKDSETIVHDAPDWSIRALESVTAALGQAIRVATNPSSTDNDVAAAFEQAALLTRMNLGDAPPSFRDQIIKILPIKFGRGLKGSRKAAVIALSTVLFLLTNYTSVKQNVSEIISDSQAVSAKVVEVVSDLSDQAIEQLQEAFAGNESE